MIKVRFRETPITATPDMLDSEGLVYLDLPEDFDIQEFKQVTELTPENEFTLNYTISSNISPTPRNFDLLKNYLIPNTIDNVLDPIKVDIFLGSSILSDVDLYVRDYNEESISIDLKLDRTQWINRVRSLYLNQMDLGTIVHSYGGINDLFNKNIYQDGDLGVYAPLIDYGRMEHYFNRVNVIPLEYWRYFHHVLPMLRKIFCYAGLEFISPLFESEPGRMLVDYLIDPLLGTRITDGISSLDAEHALFNSTQIVYDPIPIQTNIPFNPLPMTQEITDSGNHVNGTVWSFEGASGEVDIKARIYLTVLKFKLNVGSNIEALRLPKLTLFRYDKYTFHYERLWEGEEIGLENQQYQFDIDLKKVSLTRDDILVFGINFFNGSIVRVDKYKSTDQDDTTYIKVNGVRTYFKHQSEVDLAKIIDPELDALTYLKEKTRQFNLKWWVDLTTNRIYAAQPYEIRPQGEIVEGFWIESNIVDIVDKIDQTSVQVTNPELSRPRYIKLGYAESDDPNVPKGMFDKEVDLGNKYTIEETQDFKLKVFSATQVKEYGGNFTARTNAGKRFPFTIPIFRSKESIEHHWDIQPRTLIAVGNYVHGDGSIPRAKINVGVQVTDNIPTTAMLPKMVNGSYLKFSLIFGWNEQTVIAFPKSEVNYNLYDLMYKRDLIEKYDNQTLNYLTWLTRNEFQAINFRTIYSIMHLGRYTTVKMQSIKAFINKTQVYTPVDYVPFKRITNICDLDLGIAQPPPPTLFDCQNNVWIEYVELGGGCYLFLINGEAGSIIEGVTFEYREEGSTEWITMDSSIELTGEICKTDKSFYVRAQVITGDLGPVECPDITTPEIFFPICSTNFQLTCQISITNDQYYYEAILADHGQTYTVEYFYKLGEEGEWETGGTTFSETLEDIYFKAIVQVGTCEPLELTSHCIAKINCELNNIGVECLIEGGCHTVLRIGYLTPLVEYDDYILYSIWDGEKWLPWIRWDETDLFCGVRVRFRRMIIFCNNECNPVCSDIVECNCLPLTAEVSNIAFCNLGPSGD